MRIARPALSIVLAVAMLLTIAVAANANQITVFSCHDPSGNAVGNNGWTGSTTGQVFLIFQDTCASGGQGALSLEVSSGGSGQSADWTFHAPSWAQIASYVIEITESYTYEPTAGQGEGQVFVDASDEADPIYDFRRLGRYHGGAQGSVTVSRIPPDVVTSIRLDASCDAFLGPCPNGPQIAGLHVGATRVVLNDSSTPSVSNIAGALLSNEPLTGTAEVSFEAADQGPGIYAAQLVVDGQPQPAVLLGSNNGQCVNLGQTTDGTRSFSGPEPCAKSTSGSATLDTAQLHDGSHSVKLLVEDASGNAVTAVNRTIVTHNAPSITTAPSITGTTAVGNTLTATPAAFSVPSGAGSLSAITGQWLRCNGVGEKCSTIVGATGVTYVLTGEDLHHTIIYQSSASDNDGQTVAESQPTLELTEASGAGSSCAADSACQQGGDTSTTSTTNNTTNNSASNESLSNEALSIARGAANGSPASDQANLAVRWAVAAHASSVKVAYRHRSRAVGRLSASNGQPIAGATIQVQAVPSSPGAPAYLEGTVKTAADGTFTFDTNANKPSRALVFQYKSHVNDLSLAAQAQLTVSVPVPISLRIRPRTVRRGSTIRMSGSVPGPIPSGGKQIVLQALALGVRGAKWQTFNVVHTNRKGSYKATYKFRFAGPARYRIRAASRFEQDYPYLANTSPTTLIKES